jgi:biotin synthase
MPRFSNLTQQGNGNPGVAVKLDWDDIESRASRGVGISEEEALAITAITEPDDVANMLRTADAVRETHKGPWVNTCGISNAKSGRCPEKCNFCSQSAYFDTEAPKYAVKDADTLVAEAQTAFDSGVREFSIVMAGRAIDKEAELAVLETAFTRIREETGLQTCASLGLMTKENLARLKDAGMQSMHHNLETARSYHHKIVETHSYDDEVETIKAAKELGMYVCSGGIFGMGETWAHRVELALDLRALDVDSVPINFLNPRPGTPMEGMDELTPLDCLKIISLLRLVLPTKDLLVCGGREMNLMDAQRNMFQAGANGMMLGNYLTTSGNALQKDQALIEELGLKIRPPPHKPHPASVPPGIRGEGTDLGGLASLDNPPCGSCPG